MVDVEFTVVVPAFGRCDLLRRAVKSVGAQTNKSFELIVIDDFSPEDLYSQIKNLLPVNSKYIRLPENTGGAATRATGVDMAKGRYIAFLDSDDYWEINRLEKISSFIKDKVSPQAVATSLTVLKAGGQMVRQNLPQLEINQSIFDYIILGGGLLQTSCIVLRADIARKVQFDRKLRKHQDLDLYVKLDKAGIKLEILHEPLVVWDISHEQGSISRDKALSRSVDWIVSVRDNISLLSYIVFSAKYILSRVGKISDFISYFGMLKAKMRFFDSMRMLINALFWNFIFRLKAVFK